MSVLTALGLAAAAGSLASAGVGIANAVGSPDASAMQDKAIAAQKEMQAKELKAKEIENLVNLWASVVQADTNSPTASPSPSNNGLPLVLIGGAALLALVALNHK